jgi:hypothetical protein
MIKKVFILMFFCVVFVGDLTAQNADTINIKTNFYDKKNIFSIEINGFISGDYFFDFYGIKYSHFFQKKLLAGVELGRTFYGYWERGTNLGILSRYYIAFFKRFSYFAETKYLFGLQNYYSPQTSSQWNGITNNLTINLGIAFSGFYQKRFGVEFFTGYDFYNIYIKNHPTLGKYNYSKSRIIYGFQLNFYF